MHTLFLLRSSRWRWSKKPSSAIELSNLSAPSLGRCLLNTLSSTLSLLFDDSLLVTGKKHPSSIPRYLIQVHLENFRLRTLRCRLQQRNRPCQAGNAIPLPKPLRRRNSNGSKSCCFENWPPRRRNGEGLCSK